MLKAQELGKTFAEWDLSTNPDFPYYSLLKQQIYKQLTEQFNVDPQKWGLKVDSGEGHYMMVREPERSIENFSAFLVDLKSGEEGSNFWVDWISPCDEDHRKYHHPEMIHQLPEDCSIRFYVRRFRGDGYSPDGKLIPDTRLRR